MKVLIIAPYITLKGYTEFTRNQTGLGYMVWDIARSVGQVVKVCLFVTDSRGKGFESENVEIMSRSFSQIFKNIRSIISPLVLVRLLKDYHMSFGSLIRLFYYWLLSGYITKVLNEGQYDIIHIHGCNYATDLWIHVCEKCGQKYLVTLHGLNSFSDSIYMEPAGKKHERDFLKKVVECNVPITVISTGMKRLIEKTYGALDCKNITVVCNSFSVVDNPKNMYSIREIYDIPKEAKILLYVGNISENKNQKQLIDVFSLLPGELRQETWLLFCGRPSEDGLFERIVKESPYNEHIILCGVVEKEEIANYYKNANGVVLLSVAEGFGLSLIEGMHFGLPCAMFSDLDAFVDIFDNCSVVAINERSNNAVANGVQLLLKKSWNQDEIKSYSKKFESSNMAKNYIKVYNKTINQ